MNQCDPVHIGRQARPHGMTLMVSAALSLLGALPCAAQAQNNPSDLSLPGLTAPGAGIPEAPVGHRQPRPSELPPSVNRAENANPQQPEGNAPTRPAFDQLPTICVKC